MKKTYCFKALGVLFLFSLFQCASTGSGKTSNDIVIPPTPVGDYQVELRLSKSNFNFSIVAPSGNNIRFYDESGNKLNYWIQYWNPKVVSIIWVRVKSAGTGKLIVQPAEPAANPESFGESVFDRADWDSFRKDWQYSGIQSGRVSGWENPLTDYRIEASTWGKADISSQYIGATDHSRWFVRKDVFLSKGQIGFSGNTNNAAVWTLIDTDEIYQKIAGDERDVEGAAKGKYSYKFNAVKEFGRYVWAGRGQILSGKGDLSISNIDTGYYNIYARKIVEIVQVSKTDKTATFGNSIFPGDPASLPEKSITRGWRAWPGAENLGIAREGASPVLVSPVLAEKQKIIIPTQGFTKDFEIVCKVSFQTPKSFDTLIVLTMGPIDFGISHDKSGDSFVGFINDSRGRIDPIVKDAQVTMDFKKVGEDLFLSVNGIKASGMKFSNDAGLFKAKSIELIALNPKIYDLSITVPSGKNTIVDHNIYFREDFSGMREGAVFYGWKGIENFKIVSETDRIALVSLSDNEEEILDISNVPFPDDFLLGIDVGLPLSRETKFSLKVKTGTVEFGLRSDKGKYVLSLGSQEKPVSGALPGKRISVKFTKRGSLFSLGVDDETVFANTELFNFLVGRTIGITSVNPRLYEIHIDHLE